MKAVQKPLACVAGDIDLLRPLGMSGVRCAVVARPGAMSRFSRYTEAAVEWNDPWNQPEKVVHTLVEFGLSHKEKPVLFYQHDAYLLLISRFRNELGRAFRFVIPDAEIVEDFVDKNRFQALAERHLLPVPRSKYLRGNADPSWNKIELQFPLIIKPLLRIPGQWSHLGGLAKAIRIDSQEDLRTLRERIGSSDTELLAQEFIPGPESSIESYHVYVDESGEIAGEFTGKKIRTYPVNLGYSCSLTLTNAEDLVELGRDIVRKLNFKGVAKLDFKRASNGRLFLFEINPRFTLWHHLGAIAGVNLPAIVYADLAGLPRPERAKARPGVRWCRVWQDFMSSRAEGVPFTRWLNWIKGCEIKRGLSWDDPLPLLIGGAWRTYSNISAVVTSGRFFNNRLERLKQ